MKRKLIVLLPLMLILASVLASAVRFDVAQARQEELDRYLQYKADYIKQNHLEAYKDQVTDVNLARNFGFYSPSHYYISPAVLAAKYNPPLQGEAYYTDARGYTSSLSSPSAVKYYGEKVNGRYTGPIPSELNGVYFDHPQANANVNGAVGVVTVNYGAPSYYGNNYGYGAYGSYPGTGQPEDARFYARVADTAGDGFYVVGFY
jgi:hypothetical protein